MNQMYRRSFLKALGTSAGAAAISSPVLHALGDTPGNTKDRFIFIHQRGGWDVTLCTDPRNHDVGIVDAATTDLVNIAGVTGWTPEPSGKAFKVIERGGFRFGPAMGSLLEKSARMTVINGIAMNTVSHFDGTYFSTTGRHVEGGRPVGTSMDTLMANEFGSADVIPVLSVDYASTFLDPQLSRSVVPLRVNSIAAVGKSLTRFTQNTSDKERDRVRDLLARESSRLAESSFYPDVAQSLQLQFRASEKLLAPRTKELFEASSLRLLHPGLFDLEAGQRAMRYQNTGALNASFAVEAIRRNLVRSVSFQMASCDTHGTDYREHPTILQETFEIVSNLVEELDAARFEDEAGTRLSERVHIVITSDFCRTPQINLTSGRDHYPNNSAIIISPKFRGGITFGKTDEAQLLPLNVESPSFAVPRAPTPADVIATLLGAFKVDPRKYMRDGEVIHELLKT
jgi:uncharacterized protein (DUF1501 family)